MSNMCFWQAEFNLFRDISYIKLTIFDKNYYMSFIVAWVKLQFFIFLLHQSMKNKRRNYTRENYLVTWCISTCGEFLKKKKEASLLLERALNAKRAIIGCRFVAFNVTHFNSCLKFWIWSGNACKQADANLLRPLTLVAKFFKYSTTTRCIHYVFSTRFFGMLK